MSDYDDNRFPANDNLYCPDCGGMKTRCGGEWHAWNCPRATPKTATGINERFMEMGRSDAPVALCPKCGHPDHRSKMHQDVCTFYVPALGAECGCTHDPVAAGAAGASAPAFEPGKLRADYAAVMTERNTARSELDKATLELMALRAENERLKKTARQLEADLLAPADWRKKLPSTIAEWDSLRAERDEALRVRDLAREASNRDLEAKRTAETWVRSLTDQLDVSTANYSAAHADNVQLRSDLAAAVGALEPFADVMEGADRLDADWELLISLAQGRLRFPDFRAAAAIVEQHRKVLPALGAAQCPACQGTTEPDDCAKCGGSGVR
jgi:hypothetical protein